MTVEQLWVPLKAKLDVTQAEQYLSLEGTPCACLTLCGITTSSEAPGFPWTPGYEAACRQMLPRNQRHCLPRWWVPQPSAWHAMNPWVARPSVGQPVRQEQRYYEG